MINKVAFCLLWLVMLLLNISVQAQTTTDIFARLESKVPGQGSVQVKQHPDIRNMINMHIAQRQKVNGVKGFRVCIYYNSGQTANKGADQERAKFISRYEDVPSYKRFESPFFKVYVGDFRTKSEALRFLEKIEYDYPNAFIREDIVAFPK